MQLPTLKNSINIYLSIDIDLNCYWCNIKYSEPLGKFCINYYKSLFTIIEETEIETILRDSIYPILEFKDVYYSFKNAEQCNNFIFDNYEEKYILIQLETLVELQELEEETENIYEYADIKSINSDFLDVLSYGFINIMILRSDTNG